MITTRSRAFFAASMPCFAILITSVVSRSACTGIPIFAPSVSSWSIAAGR